MNLIPRRFWHLRMDYEQMRAWGNGRFQSLVKAVWMVVFHGSAYIYPHRWLVWK